jgi:hypothetical protein
MSRHDDSFEERRNAYDAVQHLLDGKTNGVPPEECGSLTAEVRTVQELADNKGTDAALKALEQADDLRRLLTLFNGFDPEGDKPHSAPEDPAKPLWGFQRPPPQEWVIPNLIPEDFLTLLIADGGVGKSFLALYMALCIAIGRAVLGITPTRGRVLYIDYELDIGEQRRRLWKIAAGEGISVQHRRLENRLFYYSPDVPVGTEDFQKEVQEIVDQHEIDVIILDSLTIGIIGDATSQQDIVPVLRSLQDLPTIIAIDHVSHATAKASSASARAFGSVFKRNIARSCLTLSQADGGGFVLQQEKSNFGPGDHKVYYAMDFNDDSVSFRRVNVTDECMDGALSDLDTHEVTLTAIKKIWEESHDPVKAEVVASWRDEHEDGDAPAEGTVRNHITKLKKDGQIIGVSGGGVVPPEAEFTPAGPS